MKTSEVLQRVLLHLRDGGHMVAHQRYACYAVNYLYYVSKVIGDRDRTRALRLIRAHLCGSASLEAWLLAHHGIKLSNSAYYKKKIMVTRKAWLAHLIKFYQCKGD